jgi:hypothetical protein
MEKIPARYVSVVLNLYLMRSGRCGIYYATTRGEVLMKFEQEHGANKYTEGSFWLEVFPSTGRMFAYHLCPKREEARANNKMTRGSYDCLLRNEVRDQYCLYCGDLEMPESLQAMWHLFHMEGNMT